ncbi:MAG: TIGR00266 family protein [Planctomycetaceae bacterium]|nr:TIGR00266 family protein [Planctomycetaceae bacterium]HAA71584.1 TIGR00266 family protein [Planctomycetaceae bacterium]|tara:strand:- start:241 stop:897 length:657 start_codon:yes stop_codon:yes gene_type:complete
MKFDISGNPAYGDLTVALEPGESFWSEGGAMSRMSAGLDLNTRLPAGLLKSILRRLLGGESLFVSEYTANQMAYVSLTPSMSGSVLHRELQDDTFLLTAGAFLGCTPGLGLKTRFGGLRSFFSGDGAFMIEVSGTGDLFFNGYGGVVEKEVDGEFIVDTGHVVAFEPSLSYKITGMGGLKQTLFSGEGLVMRFSGTGKLYLQTRHLAGMAGWLARYCR